MYEVILLRGAREYLDALELRHQAKVEAALAHLGLNGPDLRRPHADVARGKIRELRCGLGRLEHRLLYFFDGRKILVTHGFLKKTDKLPARELNRADRIHEAYYTRPR